MNIASPDNRRDQGQEDLLRALADNVPALIAYYESNSLRCVFANKRYAESNGWSVDAIIGKTVREAIGEEAWRLIEPQVVFAPIALEGRERCANASIGISVFPRDGDNADDLIRHADAAMYSAKDHGRGHSRFYNPGLSNEEAETQARESSLREALRRGEFVLFYQPQLKVDDLRLVGIEALVRWRHPERGLTDPSEFIEFAEAHGLIRRDRTIRVARSLPPEQGLAGRGLFRAADFRQRVGGPVPSRIGGVIGHIGGVRSCTDAFASMQDLAPFPWPHSRH